MISNNVNEKWGQRKNQNKPGGWVSPYNKSQKSICKLLKFGSHYFEVREKGIVVFWKCHRHP